MESCVHIYCGDGKGKTTAAVGLAVRAAGCRKKVLITRFLKTDHSGEVTALKEIPNIFVMPCENSFGFFSQMTNQQKQEALVYYRGLLEKTLYKAVKEDYDMVILDEIMAVCNFGLVEKEEVESFLERRPLELEVVLTGRDPWEELIKKADYVSEIKKRKHPFDHGVKARKGIEY